MWNRSGAFFTLSVVAMFLLVLGLQLVKGLNNRKNLERHGILTIVALALQTALIFAVIVPSLIDNFGAITALPLLLARMAVPNLV